MRIWSKNLLLDSTKRDLKNLFDRERQHLSLSKEYKAKIFLNINPFFSTDAYPHLGLDPYVDLLPSSGEAATKSLQEYVDKYEWNWILPDYLTTKTYLIVPPQRIDILLKGSMRQIYIKNLLLAAPEKVQIFLAGVLHIFLGEEPVFPIPDQQFSFEDFFTDEVKNFNQCELYFILLILLVFEEDFNFVEHWNVDTNIFLFLQNLFFKKCSEDLFLEYMRLLSEIFQNRFTERCISEYNRTILQSRRYIISGAKKEQDHFTVYLVNNEFDDSFYGSCLNYVPDRLKTKRVSYHLKQMGLKIPNVTAEY
tara:strand:+ start:1083 stop:2006 length:924 start_codon:yes stop_codon:yes gene_type:complete